MSTGRIHSIESFGAADGPGVRFVIFLQGCAMRCRYCHNPDTWDPAEGEEKTARQLLSQALRYRPYWKNGGGITVSGGEPLLQLDFLLELFQMAKSEGVHTVIDTAGQPFTESNPFYEKFCKLLDVTDLFLLDLKEINPDRHKTLTGHTPDNILRMAQTLSEKGKPMWIRHVLVPGWTDFTEDLDRLGEFIGTLSHVERVEILPYHTLGRYKWEQKKIPYSLDGVQPPTQNQVEDATKRLTRYWKRNPIR